VIEEGAAGDNPSMRGASLALDGDVAPSVADAERIRAVVSSHFAFVWRSLRHLGVLESDVDDAAQQVFLIASQKLESIPDGKERAFLFGTALRVASRARRSRTRRAEVSDVDLPEGIDGSPNPEELLDRERARALLVTILDAMDLDLRAVFILHEIEQLTAGEISAAVGIPLGTVASRLRRAREEFRARVLRMEAVERSRRSK
jgi:RNA polymerase sigma-70 factor, ECF subfamily